MELITVSSLTEAYVFPFFTADSISKQLDFRTNKYLPFFPCLHLLCIFFLCSRLYLNRRGKWQGSSGNLSLDTNGLALKCR